MHPLDELFKWFPDCDFGVMAHGFLPHGRDYSILVENNLGKVQGRHTLCFTHVVEMNYSTGVEDDTWRKSWSEDFTDFKRWESAGEPGGYLWGTNWSGAWPGMRDVTPSAKAESWTIRLEKPMFEMEIHTDRFRMSLIFHSLQVTHLNDDASTVSVSVIPLEAKPL